MRILLAVALLSGCILDLPEEDAPQTFACNDDSQCLDGYVCHDGFCSNTSVGVDAGEKDAATADAGDAGSLDGGDVDTGSPDAVGPDTGVPDSGMDGGTPDGGDAGGPPPCMMDNECGASERCCNEVCVETGPDHCGACDHSCGGGACVFDACAPFVVHGLGNVEALRLVHDQSADTLIWGVYETTGSIVQGGFTPGSAQQPLATQQSFPYRIVVDASYVIWTSLETVGGGRPGWIRYVEKASPANVNDVNQQAQDAPEGLALVGDVIYWTENSQLRVHAHQIGQPAGTTVYDLINPNAGSSFVNDLVTNGVFIYWFDSIGEIWRHDVNLSMNNPSQVTQLDEAPKSALHFASRLYSGESVNGLNTSGILSRVTVPAGLLETVAQPANPNDADDGVFELTADGTYVYYTTEATGGRGGRVFRVLDTVNGTPDLLHALSSNGSARGIVVRGGFVYFIRTTWSGSTPTTDIMGLSLPP